MVIESAVACGGAARAYDEAGNLRGVRLGNIAKSHVITNPESNVHRPRLDEQEEGSSNAGEQARAVLCTHVVVVLPDELEYCNP